MKQKFFHFKTFISLFLFLLILVSCEKEVTDNQSLIVGRWTEPYNEWTSVLELSADGSFVYSIHGNSFSGSGKYNYNPDLNTLTLSYSTQQRTTLYIVISLTNETLIITDRDLNTHTFTKSNEQISNDAEKTDASEPTNLEKKLFDTSWKLIKHIRGGNKYTGQEYYGNIITFSSKKAVYKGKQYDDAYSLYLNGKYIGWWYEYKSEIDSEHNGCIWMWFFNASTLSLQDEYGIIFSGPCGKITTIDSAKLILSGDNFQIEYSSTNTPTLYGN